jgi:hypothetical protein
VNFGMQQPPKPRPVATLDRIEDVAYRWDLIGHLQNVRRSPPLVAPRWTRRLGDLTESKRNAVEMAAER